MFTLVVPRPGEPWADEVYRLKAVLEGEDPDQALADQAEAAALIPNAISPDELEERKQHEPVLTVSGGTVTVTSPCQSQGWQLYTVSEIGLEVEWGASTRATLIHVVAFPPEARTKYGPQDILAMFERDDCTIWTFVADAH